VARQKGRRSVKLKGFLSILLAILFLAFVVHYSEDAAEAQSEVIKVRGANSMASLVNGWARAFNETSTSSRVVVSGGGTAAAFEALFEKSCQLVMATRDINEKELQAAALSGSKPKSAEVCRDCIAIIAHPDNPVNELTLEQLKKIFVGDLTNWQDMGGPNEPILVITGDQTSGAALFLRRTVMEDGFFTGEARMRDFFTDMIKDVSRSRRVISYASLPDAQKAVQGKLVKVLGVRKSQDSPAILPSTESLRNGTYPLIMSMFLFWDEQMPAGAIRQFVDFCKQRCPSR
jgi:phosphate transport system substrate-binding protein